MHASAAHPATEALEDAERQARQSAVAASPWIEGLGRFGFVAKGVVYLIIGGLAVEAALGRGGTTTDNQGALAHIAEAPFGRSMLVVLAVGLLGYALWRVVQGLLDTDRKGADAKGLLVRAVCIGVGIIYAGLSYSALRIAMGGNPEGTTQKTQDWTAWLMAQPMGHWLVALGGAVVIGNGLFHLYRAFFTDLCKEEDCTEMSEGQRTWIQRIGRAGFGARGIAFTTIGALLMVAAWHKNPGEAQGLDGALATLAAQPYGSVLLGAVAAGLAAYGLFALVEARFRRIVIL